MKVTLYRYEKETLVMRSVEMEKLQAALVLPVGGIKEKILAAKRAGIKEIIMSAENKKNIDEIQDIYLKGLQFHYVNDIKEVFAIALTDEKVADAIDLSVKKPSQE